MTSDKLGFKFFVQATITWTIINLILNGLGFWLGRVLNEYVSYSSIDQLFYTLKFIAFQSIAFAVCLFVGLRFIRNQELGPYLFVIVQFVIFHIILLTNLEEYENIIQFSTMDNSWGVQYLYVNGQHLVDIASLYFPIEGTFDCGIFAPNNLYIFYLVSILLLLVYYFMLTWLTMRAMKYFTNEV